MTLLDYQTQTNQKEPQKLTTFTESEFAITMNETFDIIITVPLSSNSLKH